MINIPGISPIHRRQAVAAFVGAYDAVPSIVAAYGMRRLLTSYTGSLLRMRRSSDNAESDFGYTSAGHLDTAAIVAWLSGSGYIVKWYDQSGNGYDATQSTAASQPLYVASGQNGRPVLRWDGGDDYCNINASIAQNVPGLTVVVALKYTGTATIYVPLSISVGTSTNNRFIMAANVVGGQLHNSARRLDGDTAASLNGGSLSANTWLLHSGRVDYVAGTQEIYKNGNAAGNNSIASSGGNTSNTASQAARIGMNANSTLPMSGDIAELVICNAALSTGDRSAAEAAANDYWNVY